MYAGKLVFSQVMDHLPWHTFQRCVRRYDGNHKVKSFQCSDQYRSMAFAQLTYRESLRDIETCLRAQASKLYHMGITRGISRNTLANANQTRDWRLYADFAQRLIHTARRLHIDQDPGLDVANTVYALDSSTIDLCLTLFPWAHFRKTKSAIKLHTLLDLRGPIPAFIHISDGKLHDVNVLDLLLPEAGAFYIMDRGYLDFARLYRLHQARCFFLLRAKANTRFRRLYSHAVDRSSGLICDQTIGLTGVHSATHYPEKLRRIKYHDAEQDRTLVFLTNQVSLPPLTIAEPVSQPLANRTVLPVDQTAFAHQGLLRNLGECRQITDPDRRLRLRADRHHQKAAAPGAEPLHNSTDPELDRVRENSIRSTT